MLSVELPGHINGNQYITFLLKKQVIYRHYKSHANAWLLVPLTIKLFICCCSGYSAGSYSGSGCSADSCSDSGCSAGSCSGSDCSAGSCSDSGCSYILLFAFSQQIFECTRERNIRIHAEFRWSFNEGYAHIVRESHRFMQSFNRYIVPD